MPKPSSDKDYYRRFPVIKDITEDEWDDFFPPITDPRKPWPDEDIEYLQKWFGKIHIMEIAYALGKPPWTVINYATKHGIFTGRNDNKRARAEGQNVPYVKDTRRKAVHTP